MKTATGNSVLRAYNKAAKKLDDLKLMETSVDAGFIIPDGQKPGDRTGWQVFVTVSRWSEKLLKQDAVSGGLERNRLVLDAPGRLPPRAKKKSRR